MSENSFRVLVVNFVAARQVYSLSCSFEMAFNGVATLGMPQQPVGCATVNPNSCNQSALISVNTMPNNNSGGPQPTVVLLSTPSPQHQVQQQQVSQSMGLANGPLLVCSPNASAMQQQNNGNNTMIVDGPHNNKRLCTRMDNNNDSGHINQNNTVSTITNTTLNPHPHQSITSIPPPQLHEMNSCPPFSPSLSLSSTCNPSLSSNLHSHHQRSYSDADQLPLVPLPLPSQINASNISTTHAYDSYNYPDAARNNDNNFVIKCCSSYSKTTTTTTTPTTYSQPQYASTCSLTSTPSNTLAATSRGLIASQVSKVTICTT